MARDIASPHIYLIAGEQSGDALGASLMRALKAMNPEIRFSGIGGEKMEKEGLRSFFPMKELSLMGFAEIVPHLPRLFRRIRQTVGDIADKKPDMVVTIDSPGFNLQVAKRARKLPSRPMLVHYVAPSIWAYKPERVHTFGAIFDHILALLPFEPPYFGASDVPCSFVGHPIVEQAEHFSQEQKDAFRIRHQITTSAPLLMVLPGSRRGEVRRHLPVMKETVERLQKLLPGLRIMMPAVQHLEKELKEAVQDWKNPPVFLSGNDDKLLAFASADAALAKSGTVTLELALAGTPMVVMYIVHPITAWIMKRMIRTPFVTLVNILRAQAVIPELLQEMATPDNLTTELLPLLKKTNEASRQRAEFAPALKALGLGAEKMPRERAAEKILSLLAKT